ncbi:MAG TPA: trypsin-like peptidase domain-containing protein [Polyangia bacterium]|jgi:hypothetical protein
MKVVIEHLAGTLAGRRVELDLPLVRFGRGVDNEIVFDAERDRQASTHHAELRLEQGRVVVTDLRSANGLYLNDRRVQTAPLSSGDVLTFGAGGPRVRIVLLAATVGLPAAPPAAAAPPPAALTPPPQFAPAPPAAFTPPPQFAPAPPAALTPPPPFAPPPAGPPPAFAPPPGAAPPPPLAPGQKVGARTVAVMIDQALLQARVRESTVGQGTVFVKSMVEQAVTRSTRKFKVALAVALFVILGGGGAGGWYLSQRSLLEAAERDKVVKEIASLSRQTERRAAAKDRADLEKRIGDLSKQLSRMQTGGPGAEIAARSKGAVYVLIGKYGSQEPPFCTGFAVKPNVLATNAHCVAAARRLMGQGAAIIAVSNERGDRFRVTRMVGHPGYDPGRLGSDVGLMQVEGTLRTVVRLAAGKELRNISQGMTMYTLGFPGQLASSQRPEATITQGVVSRMMTPEKMPGRFDDAHVLQHTAYVTGGTSGSPIFDVAGTVIGINAGALATRTEVTLGASPRTGEGGNKVQMTMPAPGYNYGMRIDLLGDIINSI